MALRRYRVVMKWSDGQKRTLVVHAHNEADAILAAKQSIRRDHPRRGQPVSTMAIATED